MLDRSIVQRKSHRQTFDAQAQNLATSHSAWMRNLHVAGDAAFRIAFRLEAPALQKQPWYLHYLIQAKDDPSLLIPADEVWKKTRGALTHLGHRFEQPQEKLLAGLGYAARLFPPVTESLKSKRPTELAVDTNRRVHLFARDRSPARRRGFWHSCPAVVEQEGCAAGRQSEDEIKGQRRRCQKSNVHGESGQLSMEVIVGRNRVDRSRIQGAGKVEVAVGANSGTVGYARRGTNRGSDQVLGATSTRRRDVACLKQ